MASSSNSGKNHVLNNLGAARGGQPSMGQLPGTVKKPTGGGSSEKNPIGKGMAKVAPEINGYLSKNDRSGAPVSSSNDGNLSPRGMNPGSELSIQMPTVKTQVIAFLDNNYVSVFYSLLTVFALFGDDIRVAWVTKNGDFHMFNMLFAAFLFFSLEIVLSIYARENYFKKGRGFNFYMDVISTGSLLMDIDWISSGVLGTNSSGGVSTAALKAGRASRAGTRAGRIVRLVRVLRIIRIVRVLKSKSTPEAEEGEDEANAGGTSAVASAKKKGEILEPSKIGKALTEKNTRRLIILVLSIIIVSPLLDGSVDMTSNDYQTSQFERLHRYPQDYNVSGEIALDHFQDMVEMYVRECNGLILNMQITKIPNDLIKSWLQQMKFQPLTSTSDWDTQGDFSLTTNPKSGWSSDWLLDDPTTQFRDTEYTVVENYGCYKNDSCVDCDTNSLSACHSSVAFDISSSVRYAARLNMGKTIFVMFCFAASIIVLTRDAEVTIIGPIERMMDLVNQLAQNPLGATEASADDGEDETTAGGYETKVLEETLGKIGRLLQVGFGAAGTEIIAKNMGGAGELDVMVPGKKITSIFGFGIIEHFTETCALLEEDVITYINTIAEIVHSNAKLYHGAANKNIGAAFLLAWKICDGTLPGMRDPRDPAEKPRMDPIEKMRKREGIFVKSSGAGKVARKVTPTELVDSALTAVLKMRVDIHNANQNGTLTKYCQNKKLCAAFEEFEVHLGFGLHLGWAIEGAIGSKYKIDASYLSPNVNMAARLEAATGQFDVPMLISEWFVDELSPEARSFCRRIDRVTVKGSEIPMDLWTFDIGNYAAEGIPPTIDADGRQKPVDFGHDPIYRILQQNIPRGFYENFHKGITGYFDGDWQTAHEFLTKATHLWEDGPTQVVLNVMEKETKGTFVAPNWWKGYRQLTEK